VIKQVIILRADLNMRKGKLAAQAAHASMKVLLDAGVIMGSTGTGLPETRHHFTVNLWPEALEWLEGAFTKIVAGCGSEAELRALHESAKAAGLPTALIEDNGATEFHGVKTPTAVAIGPHEASRIDAITGHLKLL
jgi:PTH2 family peptidyl-tRNA hydrolase